MKNELTKLIAQAAKGKDVEEFTDTVGWDDVLLPELLKEREAHVQDLVGVLLDPNVQGDRLSLACGVAGQIYGVDKLIRTVEAKIRAGRAAYDKALDAGYVPKI